VIGATGPGPNSQAFFQGDSINPCPVPSIDSARVNVTAGTPFTVLWSLWANHNLPPNKNGFIQYYWFTGLPSKNGGQEIVAKSVVSTQPTNYYFEQNVVIIPGDMNNRGTLQIRYNVNGAPSPFPMYYQCIDFFVAL